MKRLLAAVILLVFASACTPPPQETADPAPADEEDGLVIVLGDISDDPGEVIEGAQPLADYLAENLSEFGYTEGQVKVTDDPDQMKDLINNG